MADDQVYVEIPEPSADIGTLYRAVLAIKQTLEQLNGRRGPRGWANQLFVQQDTPKAVKVGDGWLREGIGPTDPNVFSIWNGKRWVKLL